ncbi:hypothetical protein L0Y69_03430 [bacterium]|nr:hypothetical protein [bacterium]
MPFATPTALAQNAGTQSTAIHGSNLKAQELLKDNFNCPLTLDGFELTGCLVLLVDTVVYGISKVFFFFGGFLLDGFMAMALSSTFIKNMTFVDFGWVIMRDIANTAFIFVLLYIAISLILRGSGTNTKELLVSLIIAALFVNFSLYLTRFVIDASNVVALEFYNHIGTTGQPLVDVDGITERSVSEGLLKVNTERTREASANAFLAKHWIEAVAILVLGGILNIVGFFIMLSAAFLFLGRVVALWFVMIFSPLAFVSAIVPGMSGLWGKWKKTLVDQALVAPVFLFFLYLTFAFLQSPLLDQGLFNPRTDGVNAEVATSLFRIIADAMNFIVAFILLGAGLQAARSFAGGAGAMAEKVGKGAFGAVVLGGAAFVGRNVVGRGMRRASETETGQKFQRGLERSVVARFVGLDKAIGKAADASYDVRGLRGVQAAIGATGAAGAFGQAGAGHVEGLAKEQKLRQDQYNKLKGDSMAQARYFNSLSFRDKRFIHGNLGVADQLALHEEVQKLPDYNDRAWHDLSGSPREHMEEFERKQAALAPKTGTDLEIERAKQTKATIDQNTGAITQLAEDKRLAQLAGITDPLMQRKILAALSARDVADLHQRAGALGGASPVSQGALTGLVGRMNAEEQEKFNSEMIKREANVANQLTHFIGITDQTVMQNVFNAMNADLRSKLFHEARAAGGAAQTTLNTRVAGLNPVERLNTEQVILKRFTGVNADADRAERIADVSRANAQLGQEIWTGSDSKIRAQALDSGAPSVAQLRILENALAQTERDRTSDSLVEVKRAKKAIVYRQTLDTATAATPVATITDAMKELDSKQIAKLGAAAFANPNIRGNLKLSDISAIYDRDDLPLPETKRLLEEYVRRTAPLAAGAGGDKGAKANMRSLSTRNQKLFDLLDPTEQTMVTNAI